MFKMAFRVVYRIKGRCSRHPAYNPVKDEQGGIKGGCNECEALLNAYRAYLAFREAIEEFETTVRPLLVTNKKARGNCVDVLRAFAPKLSLSLAQRCTPGNCSSIAPEVPSESRK
jgi:hypothetical protein